MPCEHNLKRTCTTCRKIAQGLPPCEHGEYANCNECTKQRKREYANSRRAADPVAARAREKARYWKDVEKSRAAQREWRKNNPERALEIEDGMNFEGRTKVGIRQAQNNRCAICGALLDAKAHTDHCHATGRVRGILCQNCNWGLGNFGDNPENLLAAATYLQDSREYDEIPYFSTLCYTMY